MQAAMIHTCLDLKVIDGQAKTVLYCQSIECAFMNLPGHMQWTKTVEQRRVSTTGFKRAHLNKFGLETSTQCISHLMLFSVN